MANETPKTWKLFIWPLAMIASLIIVGVKYHPSPLVWASGLIIYAGGVGFEIWQVNKDGDTTIAPYAIQTIGTVLFWILSAA